jgi:hypothetical protein
MVFETTSLNVCAKAALGVEKANVANALVSNNL